MMLVFDEKNFYSNAAALYRRYLAAQNFKSSVTPETDPTPSPVTPRSGPGQQQGDRNERSAGSP